MRGNKIRSSRWMHLLVALTVVLTSLFAFTGASTAAGEGYSDPFRSYVLLYPDGNQNAMASCLMYGSATGNSADNYVTVMYIDAKKEFITYEVMDTKSFDVLKDSCSQVSQMELDYYNEAMLEMGAPDDFLYLNEEPGYIDTLKQAFAAKEKTVKLQDESFIGPDTLKWAGEKGGKNFKITIDTTINGRIDVRMTVTPSTATKGFSTIAATDLYGEGDDHTIIKKYKAKYPGQEFAVVDFMQPGDFGTTVRVAAKVDLSKMDTGSLALYSYDHRTGKLTTLKDQSYAIDKAGYLWFNTTMGGTILITDKKL